MFDFDEGETEQNRRVSAEMLRWSDVVDGQGEDRESCVCLDGRDGKRTNVKCGGIDYQRPLLF